MSRIVWSPQALRDIESIRTYISQDSSRVAELVVGRTIKAVERLASFPKSGRKVPERNDPEIREVIEPPYRIVYRLRTGEVEIVTVFERHACYQVSDKQPPRPPANRAAERRGWLCGNKPGWYG